MNNQSFITYRPTHCNLSISPISSAGLSLQCSVLSHFILSNGQVCPQQKRGVPVAKVGCAPSRGLYIIASPKGEARLNVELLNRTYLYVSVCVFVNNAVRRTLHVLNTIQPVPFSQFIYVYSKSLFGQVNIVMHACDWLQINKMVNMST